MSKDYLSPTEAAKILGISRQAVIARIKRGSLTAERAGRQYIIPADHIQSKKEDTPKKKGVKPIAKYKKDSIGAILNKVEKEGIQTIQLWFVDILGIPKCVSITKG